MKLLDRLLDTAEKMYSAVIAVAFPNDEDNFVAALGVDKKKYEIHYPDGEVGYDYLSALNDTAIDDWTE